MPPMRAIPPSPDPLNTPPPSQPATTPVATPLFRNWSNNFFASTAMCPSKGRSRFKLCVGPPRSMACASSAEAFEDPGRDHVHHLLDVGRLARPEFGLEVVPRGRKVDIGFVLRGDGVEHRHGVGLRKDLLILASV